MACAFYNESPLLSTASHIRENMLVCTSMNRAITAKPLKKSQGALLSQEEKLEIVRRSRGAWKKRSLKKDIQILAKLRRGWERKLPW